MTTGACFIEDLPIGAHFRAPWSGRTGKLLDLSPSRAYVQLDEYRDVVIAGQVVGRAPVRTSCSRQTEVEQVAETEAVVQGLPLFGSTSNPTALGTGAAAPTT